jgi:hypothetical protein
VLAFLPIYSRSFLLLEESDVLAIADEPAERPDARAGFAEPQLPAGDVVFDLSSHRVPDGAWVFRITLRRGLSPIARCPECSAR